MKKKIVISGISLVTPLGTNKNDTWENLIHGKSGIKKIESFKTKGLNSEFGGEIKELIRKPKKWQYIFSLLIDQLIEEEGFSYNKINKSACSIGSAFLGIEGLSFKNNKNKYYSQIKKKYGFNKGIIINSNACAAGNFAIQTGANLINSGLTDICFCAGVDIISPYIFAGFNALRSLSDKESTPFSEESNGLMIGEGGGLLILELLDSAIKRGAKIYCEYAGFGASSDNQGITGMDKTGQGLTNCFTNALSQCQIKPDQIDCISTHGTGTELNDKVEAHAISSFFGKKAALQAFKSYFGHTMGASSAIEAALLAMTIKNDVLIKIRNFNSSKFKLNFVKENQKKKICYGINNAFGFGGINSCLVLKKYVPQGKQ